MNCEEVCEKIAHYVKGDISPPEKKFVEDHIEQCSSCKKEFEKQVGLIKGLKSFYAGLEPGSKRPIQIPVSPNEPDIPSFVLGFFHKFAIPAVVFCCVIFVFFSFVSKNSSPLPQKGNSAILEQSGVLSPISLTLGALVGMNSKNVLKPPLNLVFEKTYRVVKDSVISHTSHAMIILSPETVFQVGTESLMLYQGGARVDVRFKGTRFRVQTPVAVFGVVGTKFDVMVEELFSVVQLLQGTLLVDGKSSKITLNSGEVCYVNEEGIIQAATSSLDYWKMYQESRKDPGKREAFISFLKRGIKLPSVGQKEAGFLNASSTEFLPASSAPIMPMEGAEVNSTATSTGSTEGETSFTIPLQSPEEGILQ